MENLSKPIIILSSPRCGSNLLMHSLAEHPQAVCGGEWHCPEESRCEPMHWQNRHTRKCNLIKVCQHEIVPCDGLLVGLFREDIDLQLRSWQRACVTGEWIAGSFSEPVEFPADAKQIINYTNQRINDECDLVFSYESIIARWDDIIEIILRAANWTLTPLAMATQKQTWNKSI